MNSTDVFTSFYYADRQQCRPSDQFELWALRVRRQFRPVFLRTTLGRRKRAPEGKFHGNHVCEFHWRHRSSRVRLRRQQGTLAGANLATQGLAVSYPASSPQVTGVGGTSIPLASLGNPPSPTYWGTSNGGDGGTALSYIPEQVWNDDAEIFEFCQQNPSNPFCTQGGSHSRRVVGFRSSPWPTSKPTSAFPPPAVAPATAPYQTSDNSACVSGFPKPSWQTVTVAGQGNVRLTPDVSFLATPNFPGYIFCTQLVRTRSSGSTGSSVCGHWDC